MLIDLREALSHPFRVKPKQIDRHDTARLRGQIAAVAIGPDVLFEPSTLAEAEMLSFHGRDDEPGAMQGHASRAEAIVCKQPES
jgi:hypothetical protein